MKFEVRKSPNIMSPNENAGSIKLIARAGSGDPEQSLSYAVSQVPGGTSHDALSTSFPCISSHPVLLVINFFLYSFL